MCVFTLHDCAVTPQCAVPSLNARLGLLLPVVYVSCLLLFANTTFHSFLSLFRTLHLLAGVSVGNTEDPTLELQGNC